MYHTLGENSRFLTLAVGTIAAGAGGGTLNSFPVGQFRDISVGFLGTFQNHGTINVYACTNAGGSTPTIIRTLNIGSADGHIALVDINASALNKISPGTQFTHIGAYGTVESGAMWRGCLFVLGLGARSAPPGTTGQIAYGTYLA
jgi:hypothetical protein